MQSRSFMLAEDLTISIGKRELPEPAAGEALVAVHYAGLCGSDLHVMRSGSWVTEWPATLGHEIFGEVKSVASGEQLSVGDRVIADSRVSCQSCPGCLSDADHCTDLGFVGEVCPGGFAEFCLLPVSSLHTVADSLDGAVAVLAEPLAVAIHALIQLRSQPRRVAIIGHGPIGALLQIELRRRYREILIEVAEPSPPRRAFAEQLGARGVSAASELDSASFDLVIDAAGYPTSLSDAVALCAAGGLLLLLAIAEQPVEIRPIELVTRQLTLVAVNAFTDELPQAIELLTSEPQLYSPLVTEIITLAELPAVAKSQLQRPTAVKLLVQP